VEGRTTLQLLMAAAARAAALAAALAVRMASPAAASGDLCSLPNNDFVCYKLHPSFLSEVEPDWPSGMPEGAASLSAVGVDPSAEGGTEIYVSQRGGAMKGLDKGPILVFNENGDLVRQFGEDTPSKDDGHIMRNASCPKSYPHCTPDHTYGGHGLSVKPDAGQGATQIWVDDFYECARHPRPGRPPACARARICHSLLWLCSRPA